MIQNSRQEKSKSPRHLTLLIILRNRRRSVPKANDQHTIPGLRCVQRRSGVVRRKRFGMNTMLKRQMNIVSSSLALR
jgi:hypothetical protein